MSIPLSPWVTLFATRLLAGYEYYTKCAVDAKIAEGGVGADVAELPLTARMWIDGAEYAVTKTINYGDHPTSDSAEHSVRLLGRNCPVWCAGLSGLLIAVHSRGLHSLIIPLSSLSTAYPVSSFAHNSLESNHRLRTADCGR